MKKPAIDRLREAGFVEINHRPVFDISGEPTWTKVTLCELLAEMFTYETPEGFVRYAFYRDEGDTWREIQ